MPRTSKFGNASKLAQAGERITTSPGLGGTPRGFDGVVKRRRLYYDGAALAVIGAGKQCFADFRARRAGQYYRFRAPAQRLSKRLKRYMLVVTAAYGYDLLLESRKRGRGTRRARVYRAVVIAHAFMLAHKLAAMLDTPEGARQRRKM